MDESYTGSFQRPICEKLLLVAGSSFAQSRRDVTNAVATQVVVAMDSVISLRLHSVHDRIPCHEQHRSVGKYVADILVHLKLIVNHESPKLFHR